MCIYANAASWLRLGTFGSASARFQGFAPRFCAICTARICNPRANTPFDSSGNSGYIDVHRVSSILQEVKSLLRAEFHQISWEFTSQLGARGSEKCNGRPVRMDSR